MKERREKKGRKEVFGRMKERKNEKSSTKRESPQILPPKVGACKGSAEGHKVCSGSHMVSPEGHMVRSQGLLSLLKDYRSKRKDQI